MANKNRNKNKKNTRNTNNNQNKSNAVNANNIEDVQAEQKQADTDQNADIVSEAKPEIKSETKNNDLKAGKSGFKFDSLIELAGRYKRYLAAGVLFIVMVLFLIKWTGPVKEKTEDQPDNKPAVEQQTAQDTLTEEFEIDTIPEVNQLITNYYAAYAAGDVDKLNQFAMPVSDTEKSYVKVFSQYVDSYENLSCYTKSGLASGEYIVSVCLEMKFKDIATTAPGLDFFYLRTNENGSLYIDNAYSQFNQSFMEESTQADIQALINGFEKTEDVKLLQTNVQQKFDQAIAADADLNTMVNDTLPNAISAWIEPLTAADDQPAEDAQTDAEQSGDTETEETPADEPETEDKPETEKSENKDGAVKTAYAMDTVNLRKSASTDSRVLIQIPLGDKLKYYPDTEKDGWVKAKYGKKTGYVKREYITTKKSKVPAASTVVEEKPAKALPEGKEYTLSDTVNVRVSMSENASKVGVATVGDVVKVIMSYAEGWTKVEWNGQTGYIKTDLIK